jgi:hypothetical protein
VMIIRLTWSLSQWLHAINTVACCGAKISAVYSDSVPGGRVGSEENIRSKIHCEGSDAFAIETENITPGAQRIAFQMLPCLGKNPMRYPSETEDLNLRVIAIEQYLARLDFSFR